MIAPCSDSRMEGESFEGTLATQAAEWPTSLLPAIREHLWSSRERLVVVDDDPTGAQAVSGVTVLMEWSRETITRTLRSSRVFFVLTNSRSLSEPEAVSVNREIGARLATALPPGMPMRLASRSDSTLRGHFPAEVDALIEGAKIGVKATLIAPAFPEGGRYTLNDVQWARSGAQILPVADTEYARDPVFGYSQSSLPRWVEEKTGGRVRAEQVVSLQLPMIRVGGPNAIARTLMGVPSGSVVVVNAVSQRDLEVAARGVIIAESKGFEFLYRSAASFVRVRGGIETKPLLSRGEVFAGGPAREGGGLVVCGSYVPLSTAQLDAASALPNVVRIEVAVDDLHGVARRPLDMVVMLARKVSSMLERGMHVLLYTAREYHDLDAANPLSAARSVAKHLAEVVRYLTTRPAFVIGKGGVTSSLIATEGIGIKTATVLGQVAPGISVWISRGGRLPGVPYVIFPGNVGVESTLADLLRLLE